MSSNMHLSNDFSQGTCNTPRLPHGSPPSAADWASMQDLVYRLYVIEKLPLKTLQSVLEQQYGFKATERMYKSRLKEWDFQKNAKQEDWEILSVLYESRQRQGKPATVFEVRGHYKSVRDLHRFVRNKGVTVHDFVSEAKRRNRPVPDYIRALTPDGPEPEDAGTDKMAVDMPDVRHGNYVSAMYRDASRSPREQQQTPQTPQTQSASSSTLNDAESTSACGSMDSVVTASALTCPCSAMDWEFEAWGRRLVDDAPTRSGVGMDDVYSWTLIDARAGTAERGDGGQALCPFCHQPSVSSPDGLGDDPAPKKGRRSILNDSDETKWRVPVTTRRRPAWYWPSQCISACLHLESGREKEARTTLTAASKDFEQLFLSQDPLLLISLNALVTILHTVDQGPIAACVLQAAHEVTERLLPKDHPMRVSVHYLTASVDRKSGDVGITSKTLQQAYDRLRFHYSSEHPYVIAAHHNLSWTLRFEAMRAESDALLRTAEGHAKEVYFTSCKVLGRTHLQTILACSVWAGCLDTRPCDSDPCISLCEEVVDSGSQVLGAAHPYTLEAKRKLAWKMNESSAKKFKTLTIFKEVLWGRLATLGRQHRLTGLARKEYQNVLSQYGRWTDEDGSPTVEQMEVEAMFRDRMNGT